MKLIIKRNQADVKGLFGGHKGVNFSLYGRVEVTEAEKALISKYKVGDYILASYERPVKGEQTVSFHITTNDIINGKSVEIGNISILLELEEAMKSGCQNLKNLLAVMSTFGGEQIVEI